jgi:hypothetical protein
MGSLQSLKLLVDIIRTFYCYMLGNSKRKRSLQTARRNVSFENNYLKFIDFEKPFQLLTNYLVEKKLYSSRTLDFEFFFKILYWHTMNSNY